MSNTWFGPEWVQKSFTEKKSPWMAKTAYKETVICSATRESSFHKEEWFPGLPQLWRKHFRKKQTSYHFLKPKNAKSWYRTHCINIISIGPWVSLPENFSLYFSIHCFNILKIDLKHFQWIIEPCVYFRTNTGKSQVQYQCLYHLNNESIR